MIHIDTIKEIKEQCLPDANLNRGCIKTYNFKEKGIEKHHGYKSKGKATFISTYVEGMDKWQWVFHGEICL